MATATEARNRIGTYEVMFLVSQAQAAMLGGLLQHINDILARSGGEVLAMKKWDERRLAYEIDKQKRGVYILAYIACPTENVHEIERASNISEQIMRVLITKADHLSEEEIRANDERTDLENEARLRGERGVEEEERRSTVQLGRPEDQREQEPEASEDETADEDSED